MAQTRQGTRKEGGRRGLSTCLTHCSGGPAQPSTFNLALVDETSFEAAALSDSDMKANPFAPVPWVFHKDGTVTAAGTWSGVWREIPGSADRIRVAIRSGSDKFEVVFLTPKWFVATKDGKLYRVGKRK